MITIEHLKNSVSRNDVEGFLRNYLLLLLQGTSLSLPKSTLQKELEIQWRDCIPKPAQFYTDQFIQSLSKLWLELLTEQGGVQTDSFLENLLHILNNKIRKKKTQTQAEPLLNEVSLSVSEDYYKDKKARESQLPEKDKLLIKLKQILERERSDLFIIGFLALSIQDQNYKVPRISIPEKINNQWKRIITQQLKLKCSPEFLKRLTSKWFYLINQKGIPTNQESLKELLYFMKTTSKEDPPEEKESQPKGFLARLFNSNKSTN